MNIIFIYLYSLNEKCSLVFPPDGGIADRILFCNPEDYRLRISWLYSVEVHFCTVKYWRAFLYGEAFYGALHQCFSRQSLKAAELDWRSDCIYSLRERNADIYDEKSSKKIIENLKKFLLGYFF